MYLDGDLAHVGHVDIPRCLVLHHPKEVSEPFPPYVVVGIGQWEILRIVFVHDGFRVDPDQVPLVSRKRNSRQGVRRSRKEERFDNE